MVQPDTALEKHMVAAPKPGDGGIDDECSARQHGVVNHLFPNDRSVGVFALPFCGIAGSGEYALPVDQVEIPAELVAPRGVRPAERDVVKVR